MLLPQKREVFWAAGPFTPRKERAVTQHELWYRYVPESGNWHDGTCTRKIEAFSAATCMPLFGPYTTAQPDNCWALQWLLKLRPPLRLARFLERRGRGHPNHPLAHGVL